MSSMLAPLLVLLIMSCVPAQENVTVSGRSGRLLNCGARGLCKNKSAHESNLRLCYCDDDCSAFRDCCEDRVVTPVRDKNALFKNIPLSQWNCRHLPDVTDGIYMVTSCPLESPISRLCSRIPQAQEKYDYMLDIPVHSLKMDIWYQNFYCAICNNDSSSLEPYNLTVECSSKDVTKDKLIAEGKYIPGSFKWNLSMGNETTVSCNIGLLTSEDIGKQRKCIPQQIDKCPAGTDKILAEKCSSYSLLTHLKISSSTENPSAISSVLKVVYKNPHCAVCNGESEENLQCKVMDPRALPGPSLFTIIDIGWDVSSSKTYCLPPNGIWDVLHKECLSLKICDQGFHFNGSVCVQDHKNYQFSLDSCYKIYINKGEYLIKENGTLLLNSSYYPELSTEEFQPLQYSKEKNGTIGICSTLIQEVYNKLIFYSEKTHVYLTIICCSLSILCLLLHIAVYWALPKLCNLPGKNLLALSLSLLLAQIFFLFGLQPIIDISKGVCVSVAGIITYFYLAAFCWMNVMSVDIWRTFSSSLSRNNSGNAFRYYSIYGWGCPAVIVMLAIIADFIDLLPNVARPYFAKENICWFGSRLGQGIFFTLPVITLLLVNIGLFAGTVYKIQQQSKDYTFIRKKAKEELSATLSRSNGDHKDSQKTQVNKNRVSGNREQARLYLYIKLFIIMGVTWFFGFLATLGNIRVLMYPFLLLNGLQGVFIFVMFDLKKKTGKMLWEKFLGHKYEVPPFLDSRTSTSNTNSSTSSTILRRISRLRESSISTTGTSSGIFRASNNTYDNHKVRQRVTMQPSTETIAENLELMPASDKNGFNITVCKEDVNVKF